MKNVYWIIPNSLAGRPGPTHEPWSLAELRESGFDTVINLSEIEPAYAEFAEAQLEVAWFPLPNDCPPVPNTYTACLSVLPKAYEFLLSRLEAKRKVLVHCVWGCDRTGMLLAYHLAHSKGLSADSAIARIRQERPAALKGPGLEELAKQVITQLLEDSGR